MSSEKRKTRASTEGERKKAKTGDHVHDAEIDDIENLFNYVKIYDIKVNGLSDPKMDPYVKITMNPDGPSKKNKNKTQTEQTAAAEDTTDYEFPEALYFKVDDETPAMPVLEVEVMWEKSWWGFHSSSQQIGKHRVEIIKSHSGVKKGIQINTNKDATVAFSWCPAFKSDQGFVDRLVSPEILQGITIPGSQLKHLRDTFQLNVAEVIPVVEFIVKSKTGTLDSSFVNKPKFTDPGVNTLEAYIDFTLPFLLNAGEQQGFEVKDAMHGIEGYHHFGTQDRWAKVLTMLCQCNPFFANALTYDAEKKNFLLNCYDPNYDPKTPENSSIFVEIMNSMLGPDNKTQDNVRKINVTFNDKMEVIAVYYADKDGNMTPASKNAPGDDHSVKNWDYYCSGAIYNLLFYSECVHATIHILHYIMIMGMTCATHKMKGLGTWAKQYEPSIAVKYAEVGALLINNEDSAAITGIDGIGGSYRSRDGMKQMMITWGKCNTATEFIDSFLLKSLSNCPPAARKKGKILTEVSKHFELIEPFAKDVRDGFAGADKKDFNKAEQELGTFLRECGDGISSIASIEAWVNLMSITGIVHGSTLSFSRTGCMPAIMRWRKIDNPLWEAADASSVNTACATTTGMTEDRHVFTSQMNHTYTTAGGKTFGKKFDYTNVPQKVEQVLMNFDDKSKLLKLLYQEGLKDRKGQALQDFKDFGWILTDHCPDGFDGKQHTIATYF